MRAYERRQLKQDQFVVTTKETFSWAVEHREKLVWGGVAVAVVLLVLIAGWFYFQYQDQDASVALGKAMQVYNAPLGPAGQPANPQERSFGSAAERAKAANAEFQKVADKYSHTRSGALARYFVGVTAMDMGDNATAERVLKEEGGSREQDLAALAKFSLASLYHRTGRDSEAVKLYQDLIEHPTRTVAKATAQLELAWLYEGTQPAEARRIYEQIRKDDARSPAAELAASRLAELK